MFIGSFAKDKAELFNKGEELLKLGGNKTQLMEEFGLVIGLDGMLKEEIDDSNSFVNDNIDYLFREKLESGNLDALWYKTKEDGTYTITINRMSPNSDGLYREITTMSENDILDAFNFDLGKAIVTGKGETISSKGALIKQDNMKLSIPNIELTLGDVFNHDELYALYPDLKHMPIDVLSTGAERGQRGGLSKKYDGSMSIKLSSMLRGDKAQIRKTLLHEVQHAVQEIQNWAVGANTSLFKDTDRTLYDVTISQAELNDLLLENPLAKSAYIKYLSVEHELDSKYFDNDVGSFDPDLVSESEFVQLQAASEILDEIEPNVLRLHYSIEEKLLGGKQKISAFDIYEHSAGEVEARLAASRADMSMSERSLVKPYSPNEHKRAFVFFKSNQAIDLFDDYVAPKVSIGLTRDESYMELFMKDNNVGVDTMFASAYVFLKAYSELAKENVSEKITNDYQAILDWHKSSGGSGIMSPSLAKMFAKAFEHYILYAEAPKVIESQLGKFKRWISGTTNKLRANDNEERGFESLYPVFDRLLGSMKTTTVFSEALTEQFMEASSTMSYELAKSSSAVFDAFYESLSVNTGMTSTEIRKRFQISINSSTLTNAEMPKRQFGMPAKN